MAPSSPVPAVAPQLTLDHIPAAAAHILPSGVIEAANDRWWSLLACDGDTPVPRELSAWFPEEPSIRAALAGAARGRGSRRVQARRADGVPITLVVEAALEPVSGTMLCLARELAGDELLSESQRYLDVAFEIAPVGMALFDTSGRYVRVNDALCQFLGRSRAELIGRRDQELTHPDDRPADVEAAWRILRGELDSWQTEKRFLHASGRVVWAIANLAFIRGEAGRPLSWLGQFQDITQRKRREERLGHLAVHDELTGAANRRGLMEELAVRIGQAARKNEPGAVFVLDLDGFKQVNDRDGHLAGDHLLREVAVALRARLRPSDVLARLGGDEFAVIISNCGDLDVADVARRLLTAVRSLRPGQVSASCGYALFGAGSTSAEALLVGADRAMYAAKAAGRDCVKQAIVGSAGPSNASVTERGGRATSDEATC